MHSAWQAYTNELENKVSHLEEENERLKRQKVPYFLLS
jgi:ABA responsive element binding factor